MNNLQGYVQVKVGNISQAKLKKALDGQAIRLTNVDLSGNRVMVVHPSNKDKINKAKKAKKGAQLHFTGGEILTDLAYHERAGAGLSGGSLWSWIKEKAWPWVKQNWNILKPVASAVADVAIPAVATAFGQPELAGVARGGLKSLTGVGVSRKKTLTKGTQEAKDHMAMLRAKRTTGTRKTIKGASFRMP